MNNIIIRKATEEDARSVVEVNAYTWLTTYKGLIPDEILENNIKSIEERIPKSANSIRTKNNVYVAQIDDKVVGIMGYGKSRNEEYNNSGEIYYMYVLKEYQGLGLGKKLFMTGIKELIDQGYDSMVLNVLEGNKTINFYEKYNGKKVGEKHDYFGETLLTEYIMYFNNLKNIYEEYNAIQKIK